MHLVRLKRYVFAFPFFTIFLFAFLSTNAQYTYIGKVTDLTNSFPIGETRITNLTNSDSTLSDQNGAFVWEFNSPEKTIKYRIVYNVFYSPISENIFLQLYNLHGQKILQTEKLGPGGTFSFPFLPDGIFLLNVFVNNKKTTFKVVSENSSVHLLQNGQIKNKSGFENECDTLLFSKTGYYEQNIKVPKKNTSLHVKLIPKNANLDFLNGIPDYKIFQQLQSSPFVSNQGEVESVKFIYDQNTNRIYFMNTKRYDIHYNFAKNFLGYQKGHSHFNATQYSNSNERFLFPGSVNYYKALDKYILRFYPGDEMNCSQIEFIFNKIISLTYFNEKLCFYPNNPNWDNCTSIPVITSDELYGGQNYQALNTAKGFGYLKKVQLDKINETYIGKHDVVLLNGIPNDIPVVSGIITTEFQTPLSHINILSKNRGTPNMALRNAWENQQLDSLHGKLVFLEVQPDSFVIREANIDEANLFWSKNEPQTPITLEKDLTTNGLVNLYSAGLADVKRIGGKAANFAELLKLKNPKIPTPENPFAIPFFYYNQHIETNNIQFFIEQILIDSQFKTNQEYRKQKLNELQQKIIDAPINTNLVQMVKNEISNFEDFSSFRFRSSTNAEDLEFFSGAGLYGSFSAKKDNETKTIENAIKKVWASLWDFRAFEEREYYKINHLSTAMGILVHRSFPDEEANGVLITKNLYNINPGFIVNTQFKEHSIVFPEPGILHDQIILYAYSLDYSRNFTIEYLSHSNISEFEGKNVLSNQELYDLGDYCMQIKNHFFYNLTHSCNCHFDDFGLDIEFKIDIRNGKRKLYIKQVRLYN